jgi:folate-binding protein YgfZ
VAKETALGRREIQTRVELSGQAAILSYVNRTIQLPLHKFHQDLGAQFTTVNGAEVVAHYGDALAEHTALHETAGVLDLSFRSRLCLLGADRVRFLHGQVTNDVKKLRTGEGCYAALVTAKGRMESDLNLFALPEELLLDFEPGLATAITRRLEKYVVADDVQVVDVAPHYGLLSVQGAKAEAMVRNLGLFPQIPQASLSFVSVTDKTVGEIYLMNHPRLAESAGILAAGPSDPNDPERRHDAGASRIDGFDIFVPSNALTSMADKLVATVKAMGGAACGWTAFETARIEAGLPRYGADMDETNLPLECGIEARAISYNKGCYLGQEVINRIHSIGHVNRQLRGLRLADDLPALPARGDKLFKAGKEAGYITSAVHSPSLDAIIALGYVRREAEVSGGELRLRLGQGEFPARLVDLPFVVGP